MDILAAFVLGAALGAAALATARAVAGHARQWLSFDAWERRRRGRAGVAPGAVFHRPGLLACWGRAQPGAIADWERP